MRWYACLIPFLILAAPAQAAWKQASSDNFIVYSDGLGHRVGQFYSNTSSSLTGSCGS